MIVPLQAEAVAKVDAGKIWELLEQLDFDRDLVSNAQLLTALALPIVRFLHHAQFLPSCGTKSLPLASLFHAGTGIFISCQNVSVLSGNCTAFS